MGGAPTPKWDPIGCDPQPYVRFEFLLSVAQKSKIEGRKGPAIRLGAAP